MEDIGPILTQLSSELNALEGALADIGVGDGVAAMLGEDAVRARARVAVVGAKRGKSALINAIVRVADLLPSGVLPTNAVLLEVCPSAPGAAPTFGRADPRPGARFEISDQDSFREALAGGDTALARWRITVDNPSLREAGVELAEIGWPGGSLTRDFLAERELERADAVVVVLDVHQAVSLADVRLLKVLLAAAKPMVLALHRTDAIPSGDVARVEEHARSRLSAAGVPPDVAMVSTTVKEGSGGEASIDALRTAVLGIVGGASTARTHALEGRVRAFLGRSRKAVEGASKAPLEAVASVTMLESQVATARQARQGLEQAIARGAGCLADPVPLAAALDVSFQAALPELLEGWRSRSAGWTSPRSLLADQRGYTADVVEAAGRALREAIEGWTRTGGAAVLQDALARSWAEATRDGPGPMPGARASAAEALGTASRALASAAPGANPASALGPGVIAGLGSLVGGYVLSDIVLFYVLGAIQGFLNPVLLLASVATGFGLWKAKGGPWAEAQMRRTVADAVAGEFAKPAAADRQRGAFVDSARAAMTDLAAQYTDATSEPLASARRAEAEAERAFRGACATSGSPDELSKKARALEVGAHRAIGLIKKVETSLGALGGLAAGMGDNT